MAKKFETAHSLSPSGAQVFTYKMTTQGPAKGVVQISHGLAEHGARYERFANALADAGYHSISQDHRGHGNTTAADAPLGAFSNKVGLQKVMVDMHHVNSLAQKMAEGKPIILFGHSMGTILGFNYLLRHSENISGAALWNSGFDTGALFAIYKILLKTERMFKGSDAASAIAHRMTFVDWNSKFKPNRTEADWLSRDEAEVDKFVDDPLCGIPITIGLWFDLFEAIEFGADDSNLSAIPKTIPIHLIGGGVDPCTNSGMAVTNLYERLKQAGLSDAYCEVLENTRHESLNEINRDEVTAQFIQWLNERFAKS